MLLAQNIEMRLCAAAAATNAIKTDQVCAVFFKGSRKRVKV